MSDQDYPAFQKIPRHRRPITITEKIDGTNGLISIQPVGEFFGVRAGGRTRWLSTESKTTDNFGFARWVDNYRDTLITDLGEGDHYGEWWGNGIQRGYGIAEKRFSLFNVTRWDRKEFLTPQLGCVPVITTESSWVDAERNIAEALEGLKFNGSLASPGFMKPEGIIIFQHSSNTLSKITLERDDEWKGKAV